MTSTAVGAPEPRPAGQVLREIAAEIRARPRYRVFIAPGFAVYAAIVVGNAGLSLSMVDLEVDERLKFGEAYVETHTGEPGTYGY
jgi:hypothetical protein